MVYSGQAPPVSPTLYEGEGNGKNACGNCPVKRTMEARALEGGKIGRHGLTTDEKVRKILAPLLRKA
ncbi:MAG: hypothetical protein LBG27_09585 [Spirochaetaceae bacterium]|nr:hypothetical protein [Spirochaetaceae bacterium]